MATGMVEEESAGRGSGACGGRPEALGPGGRKPWLPQIMGISGLSGHTPLAESTSLSAARTRRVPLSAWGAKKHSLGKLVRGLKSSKAGPHLHNEQRCKQASLLVLPQLCSPSVYTYVFMGTCLASFLCWA